MRIIGTMAAMALLAAPIGVAQVQVSADDQWCRDGGDRDRGYFCEVREVSMDARATVEVNASPNGGIAVTGWDQSNMRVRVRVTARADTDADAKEIVQAVAFQYDGGAIRATGPKNNRDESWSASYRLSVPRRSGLRLQTVNGGLAVEGVTGDLSLQTTNGGIDLAAVGGNVRARTTNGGMAFDLDGGTWNGAGLDAQTTNGGITLRVPDGYSAHLAVGTVNGGLDFDFPVTVQGRLGKNIEVDIGNGGAPIRLKTTNGGVAIERK